MNHRRRILTVFACGLVALLVALMFSSRRKDTVPLAAIIVLEGALSRDGFTEGPSSMSVDEIALPRIPGLRSLVSAFYPEYRKQTVNHSYSKDGAKLGIDYEVRGVEALNVSLSADAAHCKRARQMAQKLSEGNPNLTIWLRTNQPPIATKR